MYIFLILTTGRFKISIQPKNIFPQKKAIPYFLWSPPLTTFAQTPLFSEAHKPRPALIQLVLKKAYLFRLNF
jgi:hypothetical protein